MDGGRYRHQGAAAHGRGGLSAWILVLALVVPILLSLAWAVWASVTLSSARERVWSAQQAVADARLFDQVLTMSATLAVQTGEQRWIDQYASARQALDQSLTNARDRSTGNATTYFLNTLAANDGLVALELKAIGLAQKGELADARAVLASAKYTQLKQAYAQALAEADARSAAEIQRESDLWKWLLLAQLVGMVVVVAAVVIVTRRLVQRSQRAVTALHESTEASVIGLALIDSDRRLTYANPALARLLGFVPDDLRGCSDLDLTHADDIEGTLADWALVESGRAESFHRRKRYLGASGEPVWVDVFVAPVREQGCPVGLYVEQVLDASDAVAAREYRQHLEASERRFRVAVESAPAGVALARPDGRFIEVNAALGRLLGIDHETLVGRTIEEFIAAGDRESTGVLHGWLDACLAGSGPCEGFEHEHYLVGSGRRPWVKHSVGVVFDTNALPYLIIHQFIDDSATHELHAELAYQATHDALTGLSNRNAVQVALQGLVDERRENSGSAGVLFCDVDKLKEINDTLGHNGGDTVLTAVAERMVAAVRTHDVVARIGGDEFVAVLLGVHDLDEVANLAEHVRTMVSVPVLVDGNLVDVSLSIGATLGCVGENPDDVLARADEALYDAKEAGRDQVAVA